MVVSEFWLQKLTKHLGHRVGQALALAGVGLLAVAPPTLSAEEIIITFGFFERTVSIEELAAFARGEGLSPQLSEYVRSISLSEADLAAVQEVLNQRIDLSVVELSQFFYTAQGETLLSVLGEVLQTPTRRSGSLAIRAALILAAADDANGLTLLNFLIKYPTPGIRVDVSKGLGIAATVAETLEQTERAVALVQDVANTEAQQPVDNLFRARQLINAPPPYTVTTRPFSIPERGVEATLFLPKSNSQRLLLPDDIPIIVISHGLGDERASYRYLAEYLTRRGFVVATLDHPGSNADQITDLLQGLSPNVVDNREFINRPGDISALLDTIQQFALQDRIFRRRLNLRNVGLVGQSFGGYTALALAGATFDPETLAAACGPQLIYLNPSLLLQCEAMRVAADSPYMKDDRVQAILVVNPIGSSIFGESGYAQLEVPIMMMAATADTVAPALPEQIEPFTWLQTRYRYLALVSETTHFSVIANDPEAASLLFPLELRGSSPELAQEYLQTLSLAFFQRHLRQDGRYDAALTARYMIENVEQSPLQPLSFIKELSPELLTRRDNQE